MKFEINKDTYSDFFNFLDEHRTNFKFVLDDIEGIISCDRISDDYFKYIIRDHSENIKVIVVDLIWNNLKSIYFAGDLAINLQYLNALYGHPIEKYAAKDDFYVGIFKSPRDSSILVNDVKKISDYENLKNIQFSFQ